MRDVLALRITVGRAGLPHGHKAATPIPWTRRSASLPFSSFAGGPKGHEWLAQRLQMNRLSRSRPISRWDHEFAAIFRGSHLEVGPTEHARFLSQALSMPGRLYPRIHRPPPVREWAIRPPAGRPGESRPLRGWAARPLKGFGDRYASRPIGHVGPIAFRSPLDYDRVSHGFHPA